MVYPSDDQEVRTRLLARRLKELRARLHDHVKRKRAARDAAKEGLPGSEAEARPSVVREAEDIPVPEPSLN